jgi:hypothetical protein
VITAEIDRLDIELRSIPGVVAVGIDEDDVGLIVQVIVVQAVAGLEVRERVRRTVATNVREPVSLEVVIDVLPA